MPHGVPRLPLVDPDTVKPHLGLEGRLVILSFGLLGPGKGYESAIAAMPAVSRCLPLGALRGPRRHAPGPPACARARPTADRLEATAEALDVTDHVRFVDRFVGRTELGTWLEAADIFVTPYPNLDQIVSGTLSYAMGAGKAVVSTPYAYARERLAGGRGRLVTPGSPEALADAIVRAAREPRGARGDRTPRVRSTAAA